MAVVNPTLAFAALFLGLSGHPRDAGSEVESGGIEIRPTLECPSYSLAITDEELWGATSAAGTMLPTSLPVGGESETPADPGAWGAVAAGQSFEFDNGQGVGGPPPFDLEESGTLALDSDCGDLPSDR